MPDLHLVVDFHTLFDHGIGHRTAIDSGIGADIHIGADPHGTHLRNFDPFATVPGEVRREAKSVGTDHGTGMYHHAGADSTPVIHGYPRI